MKKIAINSLKAVFIIDGLIAVGFGTYSWLFPDETFGTIISFPETNSTAFLAILSSLSLFYILIGLTCFIGVKSTFPSNIWIGLLMLVRHFAEGVLKLEDIGKDWLIGNPYPDLIIHLIFIVFYILAIYYRYKDGRRTNKSLSH